MGQRQNPLILAGHVTGKRHFIADYLPLAEEWVLWDTAVPPHTWGADKPTKSNARLNSPPGTSTSASRDVGDVKNRSRSQPRVATAKMLDYYKRMDVKVTPQMTLAPVKPKRPRKASS